MSTVYFEAKASGRLGIEGVLSKAERGVFQRKDIRESRDRGDSGQDFLAEYFIAQRPGE